MTNNKKYIKTTFHLTELEEKRIKELKTKLNIKTNSDVVRYLLSDKVEIKI